MFFCLFLLPIFYVYESDQLLALGLGTWGAFGAEKDWGGGEEGPSLGGHLGECRWLMNYSIFCDEYIVQHTELNNCY